MREDDHLEEYEGNKLWFRFIVFFMVMIFIWMNWTAFSRQAEIRHLQTSGTSTTAIVTERILKRCRGIRCSSPVYFRGSIGSEAYQDFQSRCGRACWRIIRYRFEHEGRTHFGTEPVKIAAFERLSEGRSVNVLYDPRRPDMSQFINTNRNSVLFWVTIAVDSLVFVLALLFLPRQASKTILFILLIFAWMYFFIFRHIW